MNKKSFVHGKQFFQCKHKKSLALAFFREFTTVAFAISTKQKQSEHTSGRIFFVLLLFKKYLTIFNEEFGIKVER